MLKGKLSSEASLVKMPQIELRFAVTNMTNKLKTIILFENQHWLKWSGDEEKWRENFANLKRGYWPKQEKERRSFEEDKHVLWIKTRRLLMKESYCCVVCIELKKNETPQAGKQARRLDVKNPGPAFLLELHSVLSHTTRPVLLAHF